MVREHMLLCNTMQTPLKHDNYKLSQQCEIYYLLFVLCYCLQRYLFATWFNVGMC